MGLRDSKPDTPPGVFHNGSKQPVKVIEGVDSFDHELPVNRHAMNDLYQQRPQRVRPRLAQHPRQPTEVTHESIPA